MTTMFKAEPMVPLVPRDYQRKARDESFRLWDGGERGVLMRVFTGGGKTPLSCMQIEDWLNRGADYRAMIVSYERDLVWQFAQEVYDFLGIEPGIEMGEEHVSGDPFVTVACRASLLPVSGPTDAQVKDLAEHGITDLTGIPGKLCKRFLKHLAAGGEEELVRDEIARRREENGSDTDGLLASRLHKFDWRKNWLVVFDEAHRHAHHLKSVGHIVDWFDRNPLSKRSGLTATPKRGDGISIGHKMFPGVAIDYPLFHLSRPCAVTQGWAVPYVQKYIEVEGVDFKNLKQVAGDFDEADLERVLGEEGQLAKLVEPLLDMVADRRTLIFSPGIEMAKNVAAYINARVKARCYACERIGWYPKKLIGETAECPCGRMIDPAHVMPTGEQARALWGLTPPFERKATYKAHQGGGFQFLSVCGLCREGYNDPDISCIAVFRPVSKKASSLAEQMKGRGCRPCRSIVPVLNSLLTSEERVEAIATSEKPDCLVADLVGITGLADCASTVQIYAEGLDDEIVDRATELLEEEEGEVEEVVRKAKEEIEAERALKAEQERRRQEEAEKRAKADAKVKYSAHDSGINTGDPNRASEATYKLVRLLGMEVTITITQRKAGRMIDLLKQRIPFDEVAMKCGLTAEQWKPVGPTEKQVWKLGSIGVRTDAAKTGWDASQIIGARMDPNDFEQRKMAEIRGTADNDALTGIAKDIALARQVLPHDVYARLLEAGKVKRAALVE